MKTGSKLRIDLTEAILDFDTYRILRGARTFPITNAESELLSVLLASPNRLVPMRDLITRLYPRVAIGRAHNRVKFTVASLRAKLGPARRSLVTVFGRGFALMLDEKAKPVNAPPKRTRKAARVEVRRTRKSSARR